MPGIAIANKIDNIFSWTRYWESRLDTWYTSRAGLVLNDAQVPLNGAILPSVATLNGLASIDKITVADADVFSFTDGSNDKPFSIELIFKTPSTLTGVMAVMGKDSGGSLREWAILITADAHPGTYAPRFFIKSEGGGNQQSIDGNLAMVADTWYHMFFTYDGSGGNSAYQGLNIYNSATKLTILTHVEAAYTHMNNTTAPVTFGNYALTSWGAINLSMAKIYDVELSQSQITGIMAGTNVSDIFFMPFVGNALYEYDLTGGRNGQRAGIGTTKGYSSNGSTYCLDNGWSLWSAERVPYGATTTEIEALGYTEDVVFAASSGFINMADCIIDFDPDESTDTLLDVFDRSNTTIQTSASRASIYYNALFPYRYQIDEIANYEVYSGYYNAAYIDSVMSKVQKSGNTVVRLDEILNSPTVL